MDMLAASPHKDSTASGKAHKQFGGIPGLRQPVVVNMAVSVERKLLRHFCRTIYAFVASDTTCRHQLFMHGLQLCLQVDNDTIRRAMYNSQPRVQWCAVLCRCADVLVARPKLVATIAEFVGL
jgi:hypothetical protein